MDELVHNFFNWQVLATTYPLLLKGLWMTVRLCVVVIPLGMGAGIFIAVMYSFHFRLLNVLLIIYVDFFRAFPPLVLLIMIFSGLPFLGLDISPFAAVCLAFMLNTSSYYGEITRAGIESVSTGQWQAGRSTGLNSLQTMVFVILPQAIRNVAPDLISNTITVTQLTSIASVVALPELLRSARIAQGLTYNPTPIIAAAAIYFVLLVPLVWLLSRFERQMIASR